MTTRFCIKGASFPALLALLILSGCKKDSSSDIDRRATLTAGRWFISSSTAIEQYPAPYGSQTVDLLSTYPPYLQDDQYIFNTDGSTTANEGSRKKSGSDPQTKAAGSWALLAQDRQLQLTDASGKSITGDIQSMDANTLIISYVTTLNGLKSSVTTTYTHL